MQQDYKKRYEKRQPPAPVTEETIRAAVIKATTLEEMRDGLIEVLRNVKDYQCFDVGKIFDPVKQPNRGRLMLQALATMQYNESGNFYFIVAFPADFESFIIIQQPNAEVSKGMQPK